MKKYLALSALLGTALVANAATIIQTKTFSFAPLGNANLVFDEFDDLGGTLTLTSIEIITTYDKLGGSYFIDNDSGAASSANINQLTSGSVTFVGGNVFALADLGFSPIFGAGSLDSSVNRFFEVAVDNGDYAGGPLVFTPGTLGEGPPIDDYDGGDFADDLNITESGFVTPLGWSNYTGNSTFTVNFAATSNYDTSSFGGIAFSGTNPIVDGSVTIKYNYVPEPSSALLVGLVGVGALVRRRRN